MSQMLDDILSRLDALPDGDRETVMRAAVEHNPDRPWTPLPGPQMDAYFCEADELFYGGCVPGTTEYLTQEGWKPISEYSGEPVAQWDADSGKIAFVTPERYINQPCSEFIHFGHKRLSMTLSPDHRMPLYDWSGKFVVKKAHEIEKKPSRYKVPVNFTVSESGLLKTDNELRLAVAVNADGNLTIRKTKDGAFCRVSLRKERKKTRLEWLLRNLGIEWHEYHNPARPIETRYEFQYPSASKVYDSSWWKASQRQLEIILEEMSHWDGYISGTKGGDICFSTARKSDADFIQYAAHACGRVASIGCDKKKSAAHSDCYKVHISHKESIKSCVTLRGDAVSINRVPADRMYCFTVPTGFWLARNDNLVFITGNSAGGGKTDLGIGLGITEHERALFLRREREQAMDAFERVEEIVNTTKGRNGQQLRWDLNFDNTHRMIRFAGVKNEKDKQKYKGRPYDLYVFDEIGDFLKSQFLFIKTWNRSATPGQRCRVLCTGNPPTTAEGLWVIEYWGPWLDPKHPNPAKEGELRWFTTDKNGIEHEVDGVGPHIIEHDDGSTEEIKARSRTFIRARLDDNPYLMNTEYGANLDALPAELRNAYRDGRFDMALEDDAKQVIPTSWITEAQDRWRSVYRGRPPENVPMCAIGVDIAQGGADDTVLAMRHDGWYAPLVVVPGKETPNGASVVSLIAKHRRNGALPIIDMGGGYGGATSEKLDDNEIRHTKYKGAAASTARSKCKVFLFANKRAEAYWRFREALDPEQEGGSDICLPDDSRLVADLTAPRFEVKRGKNGVMVVSITSKDDLVERLGRSPDRGDAVIMAWTDGQKADSHAIMWHKRNRNPSVNMGYAAKRRR